MGLFSFVDTAIKKVAETKIGQTLFKPKGVVDIITKPIQYIGAVVANPVTAVTKGPTAAYNQAYNTPTSTNLVKVGVNTGLAAAAVLTGGTAAGRVAATNVIKAVTPATPKGIITAAVAAPVAVGVLTQTKKPVEAITKAPSALVAFGADVGKAIENPSLSTITNIVKENPTISTIVGAGAIAAGAGALVTGIGALENIKTRESVQDLTKTLTNQVPIAPVTPVVETSKTLTTTQPPFTPTTAVTAATAPLPTTTTANKIKRYVKKQKPQNISQRVNVIVQNKNTANTAKQTKNYLKKGVYV